MKAMKEKTKSINGFHFESNTNFIPLLLNIIAIEAMPVILAFTYELSKELVIFILIILFIPSVIVLYYKVYVVNVENTEVIQDFYFRKKRKVFHVIDIESVKYKEGGIGTLDNVVIRFNIGENIKFIADIEDIFKLFIYFVLDIEFKLQGHIKLIC
jgi:hypothetical protein